MLLATSKPSVTTLPGGLILVEGDRGSAHLSQLRPGVVLYTCANLFTGIRVIATYSEAGAWERAVAHDVPGFRRAPP